MAKLELDPTMIQTPGHREVLRIALDGIISSPTHLAFRDAMVDHAGAGRDILLNFKHVTYMNSTGMGELVRIHDALDAQNVTLLLAELQNEVRRLVGMLGLLSVLPVFDTDQEALDALDKGLSSPAPAIAETAHPIQRGEAFVPVVFRPAPKLPNARIFLGFNADPHFIRFLGLCLVGETGRTCTGTTPEQLDAALSDGPIDVAVLEANLPHFDGMCRLLKLSEKNKLCSIIAIYPETADPEATEGLRILEDEFVREPFEVREVVALATSEYARCQSESILFLRELHLAIPSNANAVTQAASLLEDLLGQSSLNADALASLLYAIREGLDNARRHGNADIENATIDILYVLDKEKITLTVGDQGPGFAYRAALEKARAQRPIDQARDRIKQGGSGGLGLGLMLRCTDRLEFLSRGNVVKLTKYV